MSTRNSQVKLQQNEAWPGARHGPKLAYTDEVFVRRKPRLQPELLIFGLGNPGLRYAATRHNLGWWVLDELTRRTQAQSAGSRHSSQIDACRIGGTPAALIKPTTFMNLSGQCLASWRREFPAARLLVLYDDFTLALGKCRLREEGSAGGHNGVQSIIEALKTERFDRIKLGIGDPPPGVDPADYVLEAPLQSELPALERAVAAAADAVFAWARDDLQAARRALASAGETLPAAAPADPEK